jgi:hypothetical protein
MSDFKRELSTGGYLLKKYFELAMNEVKYRQVKALRIALEMETRNAKSRTHKRTFIPI